MQHSYDQTSPQSIEDFGKRLIGKCLREVPGKEIVPESILSREIGGHGRASFGDLVEKYYYGIRPDNNSGQPDFPEAGVELKTTPIKKLNNGLYSAKERLVLGIINYINEANVDFRNSSFFIKNQKLMLISYLHERSVGVGDLIVKIAKLIEYEKLPQEDRKIINEDWEKIHVKIREGRAHELSEGDTLYLGACTKAVDSNILREQIGAILAKPRAYSFKSSYMTELVRRELGEEQADTERAVKQAEIDVHLSFEEIVVNKFSIFIGRTVEEIHALVGDGLENRAKDYHATLARRMLGVTGKKIVEFEAADVVMKTVRLSQNGMPEEHMSFPAFKFNEIINEEWDGDEEAGVIRASFQKQIERRFFFVVYQYDSDGKMHLKCVKFWSMPYEDREEAKHVWVETVKRIKTGHADNLPGSKENLVAHVRPHARDASDTEIVDGIPLVKKGFWLNKTYIKHIVG